MMPSSLVVPMLVFCSLYSLMLNCAPAKDLRKARKGGQRKVSADSGSAAKDSDGPAATASPGLLQPPENPLEVAEEDHPQDLGDLPAPPDSPAVASGLVVEVGKEAQSEDQRDQSDSDVIMEIHDQADALDFPSWRWTSLRTKNILVKCQLWKCLKHLKLGERVTSRFEFSQSHVHFF